MRALPMHHATAPTRTDFRLTPATRIDGLATLPASTDAAFLQSPTLSAPILTGSATSGISVTPEILAHLRAGAVACLSLSGGKDSTAMALAVTAFLDAIGHPRSQRIAVHADLGAIEWQHSMAWVRLTAAACGLDLLIVESDMLGEWEARWERNVVRYESLACVTLITPWSSAAMRFCTKAAKVTPISRALCARFPGQTLISIAGIRAQESRSRAHSPIAKVQPELERKRLETSGFDWHPILNWTLDDVLQIHRVTGVPLHPAYGAVFGAGVHEYGGGCGVSRVSCSLCVLATAHDHRAALRDEANHPAYLRIVDLEIRSGFSFQPTRWAADYAPELIGPERHEHLAAAKVAAARRREIEATIAKDLRYDTQGWPTRLPTHEEAATLAAVRREVGTLLGFNATRLVGLDAGGVIARFTELMTAKAVRDAEKARRAARQGRALPSKDATGEAVVLADGAVPTGPNQLALFAA